MLSNTFVLLVALLSSAVCSCPPEHSIGPACNCRDLGSGPMMFCNNIMNAEELIPPIKESVGFGMFSLGLFDSSLLYLPSDLFKGTTYAKMMFTDTKIMSLSDGELAFEGLEDLLEEIRANGAHYITHWDWSQLRNMRKIQLIDVHMISMHTVDQEFPHLKSLVTLGISKAEISTIHPTAFQGLENLRLLVLKDNEIREVTRKMLPNPANQLDRIELSGNKLRSFPADMFTNMPNLQELDLSYNSFVTFDEATFKWVFEKLQLINILGNDIRCDCRMLWIAGVKKPMYFSGECSSPSAVKGKSLKHVKPSDLRCLL